MKKIIQVSVILFLLLVAIVWLFGKNEPYVYENIPIYSGAKLVETAEYHAIFEASLSLSTFKRFYIKNMPRFGWTFVEEGVNWLKFRNNADYVIIGYDVPRATFSTQPKVTSQNNPPVWIKLFFTDDTAKIPYDIR